MSSLFASLATASNALDVLEQAMGVVQSNVTNASTPGYVTQTLNFSSRAFDPANNLWGGVQADGLQSSRNQFAEEAVWNQNALAGTAAGESSSLSALQGQFDISGTRGIPAALSTLYSAFSAWSASPSDATAEQQVLNSAQQLAQAFNSSSTSIQQISSQTDQQLQSTVSQIDQLTAQIASMNAQIRDGNQNDAGLEANLYNTLEQLSNLTSITAQTESDGTVSVLLNGQAPLVLGTTQTELSVTDLGSVGLPNPDAPPSAHIIASNGQDVTEIVNEGQLAALLQFRNFTIPSALGDGNQQGSLNQLAQAIADRVNTLLTSGQTAAGTAGVPLFTYTAGSPTSVAATLAVNPSITASQLAAVDPGPPPVANGIASQLGQLSNPTDPSDMLNGMSYTDFYSSIASGIGTQASAASSDATTQTQLLNQAQNMRAQLSGVSLNQQATNLLQFQQSYEAAAQMISTISATTQSLLTMMQDVSAQ